MTSLSQARRHAILVDEIERTAPEVSVPYLRDAIERCKLPISVGYFTVMDDDVLSDGFAVDSFEVPGGAWCSTHVEATQVYLRLCESLAGRDRQHDNGDHDLVAKVAS
jgi:hypothetical protein